MSDLKTGRQDSFLFGRVAQYTRPRGTGRKRKPTKKKSDTFTVGMEVGYRCSLPASVCITILKHLPPAAAGHSIFAIRCLCFVVKRCGCGAQTRDQVGRRPYICHAVEHTFPSLVARPTIMCELSPISPTENLRNFGAGGFF